MLIDLSSLSLLDKIEESMSDAKLKEFSRICFKISSNEERSEGSKERHLEMRSMQNFEIKSDGDGSLIIFPFILSLIFCSGAFPTKMK